MLGQVLMRVGRVNRKYLPGAKCSVDHRAIKERVEVQAAF